MTATVFVIILMPILIGLLMATGYMIFVLIEDEMEGSDDGKNA